MKTVKLMLFAGLFSLGVNAQTTWYEIATGTTKKLNTINFPSSDIGYIGGNDSLLLKTTDGGETWNPVNYTGVTFYPSGEHIVNLKFVSETVGYMAVGPYSGTYKTTDGGSTWNVVTTSGSLCFNEGLYFFDEQNGFIAGSGCFQGEKIDKMTAGVIAAALIDTPTNSADNRVVDLDFFNTGFGLGVSRSGYIVRTTDGGSNWDTIPSGLTSGIPLTSVVIVSSTIAYAGYDDLGGGFGILKTTDAGLTWDMDPGSATFYYPSFLSLHESGDGIIYCGAEPSFGDNGLIFEMTDLGGWMPVEVDQPINALDSYNDNVVFGVGDSGYVVVNQPIGTLGLEKNSASALTFEVYPNPATDVITFSVPADLTVDDLGVSVYSLSGELLISHTQTGSKLDVSALTPGVYILSITTQQQIQTMRFVKN
jgi:photosystem II stability/assembly factor-like uncharacterized protein